MFTALVPTTVTPIYLYGDNKGTNAMTANPVRHSASKHFEVEDYYAREQVSRGLISVHYVSSSENIADIFTKALPPISFDRLSNRFMSPEPHA